MGDIMKRAILIDGNNLLFRSYYATAYSGNFMKNSKGFPTNALYGFTNMINKIVREENPEYIMVAFDKGKNFRHELYKEYKDGRIETPKELIAQFPIAKKMLTYMGITYLEIDNYEADDIIGTFAKMADIDKKYDATIISSDRDLLQLITTDVDIKLLKQKDYIFYNLNTFQKDFGFEPIHIIDLKALEGDKSDNIPGVKGVGEKTAMMLIAEYKTIENLYEHIDDISGKLKEKLLNDKENAFFSKKLATIYKDIDFNMNFEDIKIKEKDINSLNNLYKELEFFSFLKETRENNDDQIQIKSIENLDTDSDYSVYLEMDKLNYHLGNILGIGIYDGNYGYFISKDEIEVNKNIFDKKISSYDVKKLIVTLNKLNIEVKYNFDTMIASYMLEENIKDDIAYIANQKGYNLHFYEDIVKGKITSDELKMDIIKKAKFIYETKDEYAKRLIDNDLFNLYEEIELPLIKVLADMEIAGMKVDKSILENIKKEIELKIKNLETEIFLITGCEFNISSPKQLGDILFNKLAIPYNEKKTKSQPSTSHEVLVKLRNVHPIIELILEYRNLNKIYSTYLDSLASYIMEDGKLHTIFKQNVTRTGRLSSVEPNLQNIPVRNEEGRQIRKAFVPKENSIFLSSDYSQIDLRVLAHISNCENLINAFKKSEDIHSAVASDIYGVDIHDVTKEMRRNAKSVIFGIVYGISGYGLGDNLDISIKEAKRLIDKYLEIYPGVKKYMDRIVLEAKENGYVRTLMNRKRTIDELKNTNYMIRQSGERIALNTPIQGTSADIIKKAMIDVYNKFKENNIKSKLILQIHDELIVEVLNDEKEIVEKIVTESMENAYNLVVPLKVEVDYGKNWYDVK